MSNPTVAEYTLNRLAQLGIDKLFGVPGDYAFAIDDAAENVSGLDWVLSANELNAAYAADGYARIRGAAILTTTYGVGELSALNGVMGSKAHRVPIFHLVGMPSERIQKQGLITHHNLGDTVYDRFVPLSSAAAGVWAELTPTNCIDELERVIREALRLSTPAYLLISELSGFTPVVGTPVIGAPIGSVTRQTSVPEEVDAAVQTIVSKLAAATSPIAIVSALTARYGLRAEVERLLTALNIPVVIAPNEKGAIDESLPNYLGLYNGMMSVPATLKARVESADLVLDIGGIILGELNTGFFTDQLDPAKTISIHSDWVQSGSKIWMNTAIADVISGVVASATAKPGQLEATLSALPMVGEATDALSSASFYPRLQRLLRADDTLVIETGSCTPPLNAMLLPAGVGAEEQGLWGSIGWATPAAFGIDLAKERGRTVLVTGDGAHQLTLNEIAPMGRYDATPIIFVLHNNIYGVENVLSELGHVYDTVADIRYSELPEVFGCADWFTARVQTVAELEAALAHVSSTEGAAYIEVMIPAEESQPLPKQITDLDYKLEIPPAG